MSITAMSAGELRRVPHGFFTREGGVSEGVYTSLNCGRGSGDDPASVEANRTLVAMHMGVPPEALVSAHQIHSATAVRVAAPWTHAAAPKADAMVTDRPGLALGVLTADCAPILLADPDAGLVAAAHAGWRGALAGIVAATVDLMAEMGARRERIAAAIGPCISQANYEVGHDFMMTFCDEDPAWSRFFAGAPGEKPHFDLPGFCLDRLRAAGVENCGWVGYCTYGDEARFYSNRRAVHRGEQDYGRLISVVTLPAEG